ncbi:hypothetical protein RRG08_032111 [Elysia crispata]|uniref:Uncharacterized protein n=1 Tax=Elysia crispata TaxID=231223 RepID=A0AAE0ZEH3_9GAST|nr:hypothetical protein RRG08_032111 [Elysia crispata]
MATISSDLKKMGVKFLGVKDDFFHVSLFSLLDHGLHNMAYTVAHTPGCTVTALLTMGTLWGEWVGGENVPKFEIREPLHCRACARKKQDLGLVHADSLFKMSATKLVSKQKRVLRVSRPEVRLPARTRWRRRTQNESERLSLPLVPDDGEAKDPSRTRLGVLRLGRHH